MNYTKKLFTFAILPFMFFNNFAFSVENIKNENNSQSSGECELKNESSIKVSVREGLKYIGLGATAISGFWFLTVLHYGKALEIMTHPIELLVIPGAVGLVGLGCTILSHVLDSPEKRSTSKEKEHKRLSYYYKSIN